MDVATLTGQVPLPQPPRLPRIDTATRPERCEIADTRRVVITVRARRV